MSKEKKIDLSDLEGTYNLSEVDGVVKEIKNRINKAKMKLKTVEFKRIVKETKFKLPVYLYFQDEFCNDELQKIEADKITTIKGTDSGYEITVRKSDGTINPLHINSITTEECYNECLADLIEWLGRI